MPRPPEPPEATASVAVVTMVRDEPRLLPIWIAHYAAHVPKARLFVVVDGLDDPLPPEATGCQAIRLPRRPPGPGWDRDRWALLADLAAALLARFDVVVVGDVDELLVADPAAGGRLVDHLGRARGRGVLSPFAVEVVHRVDLEPPLDWRRPILAQRRHARINASYCKPCILSVPVRWSPGGHHATHPDLHLDPALYLFHLRFADRDLLIDRQSRRADLVERAQGPAGAVAGNGWSKPAAAMDAFLRSFVDKGPPEETDFAFDWQRRRIAREWAFDPGTGFWSHGRLHNRRTYVIPDRFRNAF